jgi:hypothetical protein
MILNNNISALQAKANKTIFLSEVAENLSSLVSLWIDKFLLVDPIGRLQWHYYYK